MRTVFLIVGLLGFSGCLASPAAVSEYNLELVVDNEEDAGYVVPNEVVVPETSVGHLAHVENSTLTEQPGSTQEILEETCSCEWEMWEDSRHMTCLGFVCTEGCPAEQRACMERGPVCVLITR